MITEELISQFTKTIAKAKISQADAARRLNVGPTHLNQILRGRRKPSRDLLERMVEFSRSVKAAS